MPIKNCPILSDIEFCAVRSVFHHHHHRRHLPALNMDVVDKDEIGIWNILVLIGLLNMLYGLRVRVAQIISVFRSMFFALDFFLRSMFVLRTFAIIFDTKERCS